jgi:hypothetical protein
VGDVDIQEAVTDELKKVQKEEFLGSFSENVRPCKSLYISQWNLFWIMKKSYVFSWYVSDLKKKTVNKLLDLTACTGISNKTHFVVTHFAYYSWLIEGLREKPKHVAYTFYVSLMNGLNSAAWNVQNFYITHIGMTQTKTINSQNPKGISAQSIH